MLDKSQLGLRNEGYQKTIEERRGTGVIVNQAEKKTLLRKDTAISKHIENNMIRA